LFDGGRQTQTGEFDALLQITGGRAQQVFGIARQDSHVGQDASPCQAAVFSRNVVKNGFHSLSFSGLNRSIPHIHIVNLPTVRELSNDSGSGP
jgi:hypothetical protein